MKKINEAMKTIKLVFLLVLALPLASLLEVIALDDQQAFAQKTKKVLSIRQKHVKVFEKIQKAFEEERPQAALPLLDKLSQETDLNNIEKAYIHNFRGNIYLQNDNLSAGLREYKAIIANTDGVSDSFINNIYYSIAQVLFIQENYREALTYAQRWFKALPAPTADGHILIGQAQYNLKQYDKSLLNVQSGIDLYAAQGLKPKEGWLNILTSIYRNKNQYKKMVPVYKQLLEFYPKERYLLSLAGVYNELNQPKSMTSIYLAMYDQGLLKRESDLVTTASLLLNSEYPSKAYRIMEKGIKDGIIKKDVRNYGLYSQALFFAKEYEKALDPLAQAARLDSKGVYYNQLGQSFISLSRYKDAESALKNAISKGSLQDTGQAVLNLGLSQFEQKKFNVAKATFNKALKYPKSRKAAQNWISYVDNEVKRLAALKEEIVINTNVEPEER